MILLFLLLAVAAFMLGFLYGYKKESSPRIKPVLCADEELLKMQKEYENFLNYDGTEQI